MLYLDIILPYPRGLRKEKVLFDMEKVLECCFFIMSSAAQNLRNVQYCILIAQQLDKFKHIKNSHFYASPEYLLLNPYVFPMLMYAVRSYVCVLPMC